MRGPTALVSGLGSRKSSCYSCMVRGRVELPIPGHEPGVFPLHYRTVCRAASAVFCAFYLPFYQLHVPVQLPCYDFVPVRNLPTQAYVACLKTRTRLSAHLRQASFRTVTGGLYRTPELVHRNLADLRLLAIPPSRSQIAESDLN